MGALAISVLAAMRGYNVVYIGADVPAEDIASAALSSRAIAAAISIVYPMDDVTLSKEIILLIELLNDIDLFDLLTDIEVSTIMAVCILLMISHISSNNLIR